MDSPAEIKRQNTKLESEGAEFLVLGNLLIEGVSAYKAYVNFPGYDLMAVNPETKKVARLQVKSRWATNYDKSFPIKNFDCDFVIHVALNRGSTSGKSEVKLPEFYIFPVDVVREAQNKKDTWGKVYLSKINSLDEYHNNWGRIREFLDAVTLKELVVQEVNELPDNASIEDVIEMLTFLPKTERGIRQANSGETISHEDVVTDLQAKLEAQSKLKELRGKIDWQGNLEEMRLDD